MLPLQETTELEDAGLIGLILEVINAMGEIGVGFLVFLESVIPPIPSEVVLPSAGMLVALGELNGPLTWIWAMIGSVTGALTLYGAGRAFGEERTRKMLLIVPLVEEDDVDRADAWFAKRGEAAVLIGRVIPGVRSLISLPAGAAKMPIPRFVLWTAIGSGVWNTLLIGAGMWLGSQWDIIIEYLDVIDRIVVLFFGIAIAVFVMRRINTRRIHKLQSRQAAELAALQAGREGDQTTPGGVPRSVDAEEE